METKIKHENEPRLWNKYFLMLALANIFMAFSIQFYSTTMSLYVKSLGGSASLTGIILTSFTISALVMRILSGRAVDKKGRRIIAIIGLSTAAVASLLFRFFPYLGALPVLRIMQGAGYSISTTAISVGVTDVIPRKKLGEGIGYFGLSRTISQMLAPVIALSLIEGGNFNPIFYLASLSLFTGVLFMYFCNYEKDEKIIAMHKEEAEIDAVRIQEFEQKNTGWLWRYFEKSALPCTLIMIFISISMTASMAFITLYAQYRGIENAGLFFTIQASFMFISRLIAGKIVDKYSPLVSVIPGLVFYIISYILLSIQSLPPSFFFVSAVFGGLGGGVIIPALNATVIKCVPVNRRGSASATFMMAMDIGMGIGSPLWGITIDYLGFGAMYAGAAGFSLIAMITSIILLGKKTQKV